MSNNNNTDRTNKTEKPFSLQDDEKNWHDRQLLHFMTKTWKFLTCVTLKWLADNLNMTCSKLVLDLDVTCTRLNMTWTFTHDFTMTWAKLANDLELTRNWWMWQKLNQLTLFYLWKLKSTMTTTTTTTTKKRRYLEMTSSRYATRHLKIVCLYIIEL